MAIIDKERSEKLYNSINYKLNTDNWEDATAKYRVDALISAIKSAELESQIKVVLDVGCGSGGVIAELVKRNGFKNLVCHGIDISSNAIEIANELHDKKRLPNTISYRVCSVSELNSDTKVDLVCLIHVLEHCPDMLEMLNACSAHGKFVYINVPIEYNLFYAIRNNVLRNQYLKYGHLHFFDDAFMTTWIESNGYEIISKAYSKDFLTKKSGWKNRIARFIRTAVFYIMGPVWTNKLLSGISVGYILRKA